MGGMGSGRRYHAGAKNTVDSSLSIDIHYLKGSRFLRSGCSGTLSWSQNGRKTGTIGFEVADDELILNYSSDGQSFSYAVPIVYSACHYGGDRPWLQCPECSSRVGKIILCGKVFVCRRCANLAYKSQRDNQSHRLLDKAQILRKRLGGSLSVLDPIPRKPKGMHWKTYRRIREQIDMYELQMLGTMSASMTALTKKFTGANKKDRTKSNTRANVEKC